MIRRLALLAALAAAPALAQTATTYVVQPGDTLYRISREAGLTVEALQQLNGLEGTVIEVGQTLRLTDRVPMPSQVPPPARPSTDGVGERVPDRPTPDRPQPAIPQPATPQPATPQPVTPEPATPAPVTPTDSEPAPRGPATGGPSVHVVEAGETLFRIALRYDTSVEELRRLNGIEGDRIESGQRLVVGRAGTGPATAGRPVPLGPPRVWSLNETTVPADLVHFVEPGETLYSIAYGLGLSVDELARANQLSTAPLEPGTLLRLPAPVNPAVAARTELPPADQEGLALVYPDVMRGRPTESGEPYDPLAFTISHRELPFGTVVLVTNPASGRSTFAEVTDRGPVSRSYLVELSAAAASALELDPNAARRVELRQLP